MHEPPKNILLVSLNNLGDCIMFLPVAATLRTHYPHARMTLLTGQTAAEVARMTALFDHVIVPAHSPKNRKVKHRASLLRLVPTIRQGRYDLGIMASGENSSVCALLFLGNVKHRIGFNDCKLRFLLSDRITAREKENEARRNTRLLDPLGLPETINRPPWNLAENVVMESLRRLQQAGIAEQTKLPRVLIHPGSAVINHRWPVDRFAELCNRLTAQEIVQPVLLEGPAEPGLAAQICAAAGQDFPTLSDLNDLALLTAIMLRMNLFLGHSTGTFHLACLAGLPTVTLWGVSDPDIWSTPWDAEKHLIVRSPIPCGPHPGKNEIPPCMEAITVDTVMQAITRQLTKHQAP